VNPRAAGFPLHCCFLQALLQTSDPKHTEVKGNSSSLHFVSDPARKRKKFAFEERCGLVGELKHASLHLVY